MIVTIIEKKNRGCKGIGSYFYMELKIFVEKALFLPDSSYVLL